MATFDGMFTVIDKTLHIVGLSDVYVTTPGVHKSRILYVIGLVNLIPLLGGELIFFCVQLMAESKDDRFFFEVTDMMACTIESLFALVKSLAMVWHKRTLCSLVTELRLMWPEQKQSVDSEMLPTMKLCLMYTLVTNVLSSVYNIIPLIIMSFGGDALLLLPYHIWYPYDWTASTLLYSITYLSQVYAGIFTTAAVSSVDCLFCLFVAHLSMHFKVLLKRITDMNPPNTNRRQLEHNLKDCVEYHNTLKRLCRKVETIFSTSLFVNLGASSVIICLAIFSITICPRIRILNYLLFLSSSLIQILMMCWYGNNLIQHSKAVSMAAYASDWVGTGKEHCKAIMMMQLRTAKPISISAMGFFDISLKTFSSILSASWSYFALLNTMYKKQEH